MTRFSNPTPKYTDQSGLFMPFGLLYFFESGTNDDKDTFADVNETIKNPQPLILNGDGTVPNCFYSGSAKVVLVTNAGTPTAPIDGVQQWERDPVSSSAVGAIGREWDAVSIYDFGAVVIFNNLFYVSIINNNQNNIPNSSLTSWTQFDLLKRWNPNESYNVRDPVIATDFTIYISQVGSNLGNDPTSSPTEWLPSGAGTGGSFAFAGWDLSIDYPVGGTAIVTGSDGNYYKSIQTPNLNNDPTTPSPAFWEEVTFIEEGNITIEGDTIASTVTDSDINIAPNGTGSIVAAKTLRLNNAISLSGRNIADSGDVSIGSVDATDRVLLGDLSEKLVLLSNGFIDILPLSPLNLFSVIPLRIMKVDGATGNALGGQGFTPARTSAGLYTLTMGVGIPVNNQAIQVSVEGGLGVLNIEYVSTSSTVITVIVSSTLTGALVDAVAFTIQVTDMGL